ncbi:MAG: AAA family ATPase [Candidatus Aminicenantaceae bacterium]
MRKKGKKRFSSFSGIEINPEFKKALNLMENTSSHVFITGKAGTGKSTLLEYFRHHTLKKVVVLAPTGVAALNIRGQTIHSFFRFRPDITLDKVKKIVDQDQDNLYQEVECVIIDEISMVRADLLDCVDQFLRLNCHLKQIPFGGKQMIFIGDLYQLPPVIKGKEKEIFQHYYRTGYFFSAHVFHDFPMKFIELIKIYRQKDERFIHILNAIRNKTITEDHLEELNERCDPSFSPARNEFYIYLTPYNKQAHEINEQRLRKLKGKTFSYEGKIRGNFGERELPTQLNLSLKINAQVMLLNNDPDGRWINGSVGQIVEIYNEDESHDVITVELTDGMMVEVEPFTWEIFEYRYNQNKETLETNVVGSFTQYPLRLAWAITIHKSQGKTYEKVIIDIGKGTFSPGQMYVALSRCSSLEGIVLKKEIQKKHVFMDWRIIDFLTKYQYQLSEKKMPLAHKVDFIKNTISKNGKLEIVYLKSKDEKSKRVIKPQFVGELLYKDKNFLGVEAYCYLRNEVRNFRVDRILEMKKAE